MAGSGAERRITEWIGLSGPRPTDAQLADYLQSRLDDREDVDVVDAAVMREAVRALRERGEREALLQPLYTTQQPAALPSEEDLRKQVTKLVVEAMSWHPSESGPSYRETREPIINAILALIRSRK